jgi:hypothetical protein
MAARSAYVRAVSTRPDRDSNSSLVSLPSPNAALSTSIVRSLSAAAASMFGWTYRACAYGFGPTCPGGCP